TKARQARLHLACEQNTVVLGHFGTFHESTAAPVREVFAKVLAPMGDRIGLWIGRNSERCRDRFARDFPCLRDRIVATGEIGLEDVAAHLSACDILVQPYPDGVSSRRGTVMAGIAHGVPVVTNEGALTEDIWRPLSNGVTLAPSPHAEPLAAAVEELLAM